MPRSRVSDGRRTVLDHDGNPLIVSGVVQYQIVDTYRAAIEIANIDEFIYTQAEATLKHVVGLYPYDATDKACLRRDVCGACLHARVFVCNVAHRQPQKPTTE